MDEESYLIRELARLTGELDRLRSEMRNPQPPYVTHDLWEENRRSVGERIGAQSDRISKIESTLSNVFRILWTALLFPIVVALIVIALTHGKVSIP